MLKSSADAIRGASDVLAAHLGKDSMLQAVGNIPISLSKAGDKIHQTTTAIKDLLGDSKGTELLKKKPRLFVASAASIQENFETLCAAFGEELVLKAVRGRPNLLYCRTTTNKAVKTGILLPGQ